MVRRLGDPGRWRCHSASWHGVLSCRHSESPAPAKLQAAARGHGPSRTVLTVLSPQAKRSHNGARGGSESLPVTVTRMVRLQDTTSTSSVRWHCGPARPGPGATHLSECQWHSNLLSHY